MFSNVKVLGDGSMNSPCKLAVSLNCFIPSRRNALPIIKKASREVTPTMFTETIYFVNGIHKKILLSVIEASQELARGKKEDVLRYDHRFAS
jgi:hypothetical protein